MKIKKMVTIALLACMALCVYAVECLVPNPLPVPGIKLGLSNAVTLAAFYIVGRKNAFVVLVIRVLLSSLLFGHMTTFIYSIAGALVCYAVTFVLYFFAREEHIWSLGVFGALGHNIGQLAVAVIVLNTFDIVYILSYMVIMSVVAGSFTGACAAYSVKLFRKTNLYKNM